MPKKASLLDQLFLAGAMFFFMGALFPVLRSGSDAAASDDLKLVDTREGDKFNQIVAAGIFFSAGFLCLNRDFRGLGQVARRMRLPLALVAWAFLSTAWSDVPSVTIRKSLALGLTTFLFLYIGSTFSLAEFVRVTRYMLLFEAVLSLFFGAFLPGLGRENSLYYEGIWRGIFSEKNMLGRYMTIGALGTIMPSLMRHRWGERLSFVLYCILVILSGSRSSWGMLGGMVMLTLCIIGIYRLRDRLSRQLAGTALVTFGVVMGIIVLALKDQLLESVGRDATLTGRTDLWELLWVAICDQPLRGYGFGAFYVEGAGAAKYVWSQTTWWKAGYSHNAVFDVWVELGFVGVVMFVSIFAISVYRSLKGIMPSRDPNRFWLLFLGMTLIMWGITDISPLRGNSTEYIFMCAIFYYSSLKDEPSSVGAVVPVKSRKRRVRTARLS